MVSFYHQSREEHELELAQSHGREQSEQSWLDSFMVEAKEIDDDMREFIKPIYRKEK